jgi:hypothetical protein
LAAAATSGVAFYKSFVILSFSQVQQPCLLDQMPLLAGLLLLAELLLMLSLLLAKQLPVLQLLLFGCCCCW